MKKIYLLLLMISGISVFSFAQSANSAKSILDGVSAKLKTFKGITANFTYTTYDRKSVKRGSVSGQVYIKGQKYFLKQGSTEIYCNGINNWNYNSDNKEVTESKIDDNDDAKTLSPQKLLSDFYDKDFTYNLVSSSGNYYEIDMYPIDKRKNFKQVNVYVDKKKSLITKAKVIDKEDNIIQFALTNINTSASVPDSKFEFDASKHPGVEVISQ